MTQERIMTWYHLHGGSVYLSFSGGKDSTVLKSIVDDMGLNIPSVFVDTGLEYPEVRSFAMSQPGVTVLKPEMNFKKVIETYGYPAVSKEVAQIVREAKIGLERNDGSYQYRILKLKGELRDKNGNLSKFNKKKWGFLLDAPFKVSEQCCDVMKKRPVKKYEHDTGRVPIIGTMAVESAMRTQRWLRYGCNAFDAKRPSSNPLSFWTENDILLYLVLKHLRYASVYGQIKCKFADQVIPPPFCKTNYGSPSRTGKGYGVLSDRRSPHRVYVLYVWMSSGKGSKPFSADAGHSSKSMEILYETCV